MLLKKQTVWLLTMLSLVVVLSVYYVTSPEGTNDNVAFDQSEMNEENSDMTTSGESEATEGETETDAESTEGSEDTDVAEGTDSEEVVEGTEGSENEEGIDVTIEEADDGTVISSVSSDELFTALRMEIDEYRSKVRGELQSIVASKDVSAEEKSKAYEEMRKLQDVSAKENILEMLIKGKGYEDALVRADGENVKITVKAKESSRTEANEIIRLVRSEIGELQDVAVKFEPVK